MTQNESRGTAHAGEHAGMSDAERQERLTQLVLRRSKLSPDEAALLREVFPEIMAVHYDLVWNLLRKRGLNSHEAEDLFQEVFLTLYNQILEIGFADSLSGMLRAPGTEIARTMLVPVLNPRQGETAPLGPDVLAKAVAALPFAGNTVGAGLVPFPRLPLEWYAALRAELSLCPERSAEILPRYHVPNEAARRALEEHWQMELAASPAARAAFDKFLAHYMSAGRARFPG